MRVRALIADERDWVVNTANAAAAIFGKLEGGQLGGILPDQTGRACARTLQANRPARRIQVGKGVCGTAVSERRTQIVPDVHQFSGSHRL